MANKRICDRCGKEIQFEMFTVLDKRLYLQERDGLVRARDIDLCKECENEFYKWFENKEDKHDCECSNNKNVVELLDLIKSHEKKICEQSGQIEQLEKENEMLKNGTIKELLESMDIEISVSVKKKDE